MRASQRGRVSRRVCASRHVPIARLMPAGRCRPVRPHRVRGRVSTLFLALLLAVLGTAPEDAAAQGAKRPAARKSRPPAARPAAQTPLDARLAALVATQPTGVDLGLYVADATRGTVWFEHHSTALLKPASVLKLLTSAAALERFGPEFRFETRVYLAGAGAIPELWVVGSGDPALGDERIAACLRRERDFAFDEWAAALRARGVTQLGRIVLDASVFDEQYRHPDWPVSQEDRWYQAPVGGLNINNNCLDVRLTLGGGGVAVQLHPEIGADLLRQDLTAGKVHRVVLKRAPGADLFELTGTVARSGSLEPIAAGRPTVFFGHALYQALERRGIRVVGEVLTRPLGPDELRGAVLLATHTTPLRDVLWRCNAFSQNLFAECLCKALAAYAPDGRRAGPPGSWSAGTDTVRSTLARLGLDLSGAVLRDGSGLSHRNRLSAAQVGRLLVLMQRHRHAEAFCASLAQPGEPGSMRKRYDDPVLRGRIRAKTGTLANVQALAGYATRPDGTVLAFALLVNGGSESNLSLELCRALVTAPPPR